MWSASFATPDVECLVPHGERPARIFTRLRRLVGLVAGLVRIWLAAIVIAERTDRDGLFRLRHRHARRLLAVLGVEIEVRGDAPAYDEPVLVVSNHVSWLDPYALNCVNGARFVAKADVERWPVIGVSAKRFGTFFLRRGSCRSAARVKDQLARALRSRDPVGAFPESTTTDGSRLLRFYPAMFQAAIDARCMIQPVAIRYKTTDGRRTDAAAFVDDMTVLDSLRRMLPLGRLVVELTFCPPLYSRGRHRKDLAARARHLIAETLQLPHEDEPAPRSQLYPLSRKAA